jgi:hypothetical protein
MGKQARAPAITVYEANWKSSQPIALDEANWDAEEPPIKLS